MSTNCQSLHAINRPAIEYESVFRRLILASSFALMASAQSVLQQAERAFETGNYAEAARLFEQAHKESPRCDILFFLGMTQYRMGQTDAALINFQSAVQCDPKLTFGYLGLGEIYAARNNDAEALSAYAHVLKLEPQNRDALRDAGKLYLRSKQYEKAINDLGVLTKLEPDPQIYTDLGVAYLGVGRPDEAAAQFQTALRINPEQPSALLGIANVYMRKGKEDQAIGVLQKLVTLVPNDYKPHYLLGTAYNRESQYQNALNELNTALQLGGNESEIYYHLARAYGGLQRMDDRRDALLKFSVLVKKTKENQAAQSEAAQLVEQARTLVNAKDFATAALRLDAAREIRSADATILFRLASLNYDLQHYDQAREYVQEAISLTPSEWLYHYLLGLIETSTKHWPEAWATLETAAQLKPSAAEVQNALGQVALATGEKKDARDCFERAVRLDPKRQAYRDNLNAAK